MKKENIPNALTLLRVALIPIFILLLTVGSSKTIHVIAAIIFAVASWVVAVIICRELAVTGLRLLLVETGGTVLAAAMPGKIKTFTQMFAIIFLLIHWTLLGQICLYIALIFTIYSGYDYFKGSAYLFKDTFK